MMKGKLELYNVVEETPSCNGDGRLVSRIPDALRRTLNDGAKRSATAPGGCEVRLNLGESKATARLRCEEGSQVLAEVFQGDFMVSRHRVDAGVTDIGLNPLQNVDQLRRVGESRGRRFDPALTRVIFPYAPPMGFDGFDGECTPPGPDQVPQRRMLTYGSSITHGAWAMRPSGTYAMRLAESLGVDLINLGFGGGAHCEGQLADYIAGRQDWDIALLEMGINMLGRFEVAEYRRRVAYFVETIAAGNPDKWLICTDLYTCFADLVDAPEFAERKRRAKGYRRELRRIVRGLPQPKLLHVDGRRLLRDPSGLTFDLVHPSPGGMEEIAANLARFVHRATKAEY
jgi:lysophospholipase L1-like esterase